MLFPRNWMVSSPRALDVSRAQDATVYVNPPRNNYAPRQSNREFEAGSCCSQMDAYGSCNQQRRYSSNNNVMMVMKQQQQQHQQQQQQGGVRGHQFQWSRLTAPPGPGSGSSSSSFGRGAYASHQKAGKTWKRHVAEDPEQRRKLVVVADLQQPGHRKVVVQAQLGICVSQQPQHQQREVVVIGPGPVPAHGYAAQLMMVSSGSGSGGITGAGATCSRSRSLRLQSARKKKYCYAFTRSGRCSKGEAGRCHYIHDAAKVAVCTRFVTDVCGDADCRLTHRLIPERMPDCVLFLRGLCINERCPYRHVKTDARAAICEQFLQGSCPDASRCDSKHTYDSPRAASASGRASSSSSAAAAASVSATATPPPPGSPPDLKQEGAGVAIHLVAHQQLHQQRQGAPCLKRKRDACCGESSSDIPIPSETADDDACYNNRVQPCSLLYAAGLGQLHQAMAAGGEIGSYIKPAFVTQLLQL